MAQYGKTFKDLHEGFLAWLLKQRPEVTSDDSPYGRIDATVCMTAMNFVIPELIMEARHRYETVIKYTFEQDTNYLELPHEVLMLLQYKDSTMDKYRGIPDAMSYEEPIRKYDDDTLINDNGWTQGQEVYLHIIKQPPRIVSEHDVVRFPERFHHLLFLKILRWVKIQSGEQSVPEQSQEYILLLNEWRNGAGRVTTLLNERPPAYTPLGK